MCVCVRTCMCLTPSFQEQKSGRFPPLARTHTQRQHITTAASSGEQDRFLSRFMASPSSTWKRREKHEYPQPLREWTRKVQRFLPKSNLTAHIPSCSHIPNSQAKASVTQIKKKTKKTSITKKNRPKIDFTEFVTKSCWWLMGDLFCTDLKEASENVKLEHRNVVVAGEVNGGLQGHGLQAWADGMHLVEALPEDFPRHYCPGRRRHVGSVRVKGKTLQRKRQAKSVEGALTALQTTKSMN